METNKQDTRKKDLEDRMRDVVYRLKDDPTNPQLRAEQSKYIMEYRRYMGKEPLIE